MTRITFDTRLLLATAASVLTLVCSLSIIASKARAQGEIRLDDQSSPRQDNALSKYVGNSFSLKFHRPSCQFALAMWQQNIVRFSYRKQAVDAGYRPCRYCLPPNWKSVDAKVLPKEPARIEVGENSGKSGSEITAENRDELRTAASNANGTIERDRSAKSIGHDGIESSPVHSSPENPP